MSYLPLPQWHSPTQPSHDRTPSRRNGLSLSFNTLPGIGTLFGAFLFSALIFYVTFFSTDNGPLSLSSSDWFGHNTTSAEHVGSNESLSTSANNASSSPSDVLSLEQIRDIVAPTRGFFSRDYSLNLGWNNMQYIIDAALLQATLLNRTLVLPSFVYARACEYDIAACADYSVMVNRGDAVGSDEWRELPIEQQMAFRIPISVMLDLSHLRARHPVVTVSEYLRLHGQDPEIESSRGSWERESYHTRPNVFESNQTKTPSLFVIENHWYDPEGTSRVDCIPEAMKERGKWERYNGSESQESGGYWPFEMPTNISQSLAKLTEDNPFKLPMLNWDTAKVALRSFEQEVDLDDDKSIEDVLTANGWEVLYTFFAEDLWDLAKTIITPTREVAPRSSIRGFKDDYYHVDADVVLLAGETHNARRPGAMRFTEDRARRSFANMILHSFVQPPPILALSKTLAARMRQLTDGRLWMGAHMRRGDFVRLGWVMEKSPEAHMRRVKSRLEVGRQVLSDLENVTTYDVGNVEPDLEQTTLQPPLENDRFYVATDERDPDARRVFRDAGAVFLSDLLKIEDRRAFGWPLMLTDVLALVDQSLLAHSAYFYGHKLSSFAGRVVNLRAARGADRHTAVLD